MRWLALILALAVTAPALAQEADDGTRLERLIEDQLSGADGVAVDLVGFRGALSSNASLERLTISDTDGPWLILEEAQLVWTRSALLRGRLEVDELTAERLQVLRPPVAADTGLDLPPAEATPFALPELPVSITIGQVAIAEVDLGAPVLGIPAVLALSGSAELSGGAGSATLDITRLDGPRGVIDLDARYANETGQLALDLLVEEEADGLIAELTNLPDAPPLRLDVQGEGPITDFTTNIALETDGTPRLTGSLRTERAAQTADQAIFVDLSGDISPLIRSDYRAFFGQEVALRSHVTLFGDGRVTLQDLDLSSAALRLTGDLALRADAQPESFALTGRVEHSDGAPVRLPIPGQEVTLDRLALDVGFDAAQGSAYRADLDLLGLTTEDSTVDRLVLDVTGDITEGDGGISAVTATVLAVTEGVDLTDAALAEAVGPTQQINAGLSWVEGSPAFLSDLTLRSGDVGLTGDAALHFSDGRIDSTLDLTARIPDLTRFAAAAGQPLAGSVTTSLNGTVDLLSGAFDLALDGSATELRVAEALPPALFAGETALSVTVERDETGLTLEGLSLDGQEVTLTGAGRVGSGSGALEADLRLADLGLVNDFVRGPATVDLSLSQPEPGPWTLAAGIAGPQGITVDVDGAVGLADNAVDLDVSGRLPLALANRAIAPRSISGTLGFDLSINGPPGLSALSGTFRSGGARVSLPVLQTALDGVSLDGRLTGGQVSVNIAGNLASGGSLNGDATVNLRDAALPIVANIAGRNLRLIDPTLYDARIDSADLRYSGAILGSASVSGAITLGESELRVPETGLGASSIPEITHIGETAAERQTRIAAGLIDTGNGGSGRPIALDLSVSAPGRIFLRGRGLDAELGGALQLGGTSADVIPSGRFDLIRGRLSILGTRLDLTDGSATLQGSFDPFVRLLATSRAGGFTIGISVIGFVTNPEITFSSDPTLPEDEVLAQLLFGRSVSSLSPVQLLQLADAAASLAGGSTESGVFSNLREGLGLDDLDLQTDEQGNAAVRAGRYLSDNIYTDLTVNADGETDLSLNIDLTPDITARGQFSSDGDSALGVFFERDY